MFDVWKNVLAEVEQAIPHTSFVTFFSGTELVRVEDGVARVGAPNVFIVKQLQQKYHKEVEGALKRNGVEFTQVEYVVQTSSKVKRKSGVEVDKTGVYERRGTQSLGALTKKLPNSSTAIKTFSTGLNPSYTLDSFVIGSNNDLAVSVARSVIEHPGEKYNPFFLYGGPGLGKTHLVQAIGNELLKRNPEMRVLYTPTNHFYSEFIDMIKKSRGDDFSQKYRKLDVLIIDDFQQIIGKDRSQDEFFNIFNDLHQAGKQIIVTSDRLPSQIATIDERLASRLTWAGAIDLQMPNFEDKCAILKSMAEFRGAEIEDEAIEYIAENVKTNIRDLAGELIHLLAISEFKNISPLEVIRSGYAGNGTSEKRRGGAIPPSVVVEKVADFYDLTVKEMTGRSRVAHIKTARQVAMFLLTEEVGLSTTRIAQEVGVKDHTTVMHGVKKIRSDLKLNFGLREQISAIREKLYE